MNLERLFARRAEGVRLDLDTITAVHRALGSPAADIPALHVVGTNGKGSVAAMVDQALRRRGHRVGLYTSPHLVRVTERVRVDGEEVSEAALSEVVDRVLAVEATASLPRPLSFFEILTLAALQHLASAKVDVLVAEAGLGGRLDATRIVRACATAVTSIDLDHQAWLGDDLASIASEKAAVLRPGVPCISAPQHPEVWAVLESRARQIGAPLVRVGPASRTPRGLHGEHQRVNAAVALHAAQVFDPAVRLEHIDGVSWPGRLEWVSRGQGGVLLDVAHNPGGIEALVEFVRGAPDLGGLAEATIVFGCAPDKDRDTMLTRLCELGRPIWWVPPSRCSDASSVRTSEGVHEGVVRSFEGWDDVRLALALEQLGGALIVCGSHMLVGPLRARWMGDTATPDPTDPMRGRVFRAGAE